MHVTVFVLYILQCLGRKGGVLERERGNPLVSWRAEGRGVFQERWGGCRVQRVGRGGVSVESFESMGDARKEEWVVSRERI
jgi:hypothetical protein